MARLMVVLASLLLLTGCVIAQDNLPFGDDPFGDKNATTSTTSTTTTPETTTTTTTSSTTTPTTTTPTTTPETTTPTTTPETTTPTTTSTTTPSTTTPTTTPETTTPTTTSTTTSTTTPETTTPTTTVAPTTTTPAPKPDSHIKYNVTENFVTCVMVGGEIFFNVNYTLTDNSTAVSKVFIPDIGVTVTGSCNGSDGGQWIAMAWGKNTAEMNFAAGDKDSWTLTNVTATLYMGEDNFGNATDAGKTLELTVDYDFSPGEVGVNHSFICRSDLTSNNLTAVVGPKAYTSPITSTLKNIQIQAFSKASNETDFMDSVHCTADNTSDVVPIAVGCALAGLVVIVLIAYLVGRRRRSGAYQSV